MRDVQGSGEGDPICRVVVLEDTNADGKADKSTLFLDKLVMPRSFAFVKGGILLQEPPKLWFCADKDGDLRCDRPPHTPSPRHAHSQLDPAPSKAIS